MKAIARKLSAAVEARKINSERGYTLLEYCAGAAIIAGVVWGAMFLLGEGLRDFLTALTGWVAGRTGDING